MNILTILLVPVNTGKVAALSLDIKPYLPYAFPAIMSPVSGSHFSLFWRKFENVRKLLWIPGETI
jgi:hypothetical protein